MTTDDSDATIADMLHHRAAGLAPGDPLSPPLVLASKFAVPGTPDAPYVYGRNGTPTWTALEEALGALEQAEVAIFPSGMAAITAVLQTQLASGDRVLIPSDGYYNTRRLAERVLAPSGITFDECATPVYADRDFAGYAAVFVETPSNPGLDVCDIADVAARAKAAGAKVIADNTTLTPLGQRPLDLGADIVVASDTKALGGHADALLGHVASRDAAVLERVREWRTLTGSIPGQLETWLIHRGLETLEVRFDRMCTSAAILAERLTDHPAVRAVVHPALASHPGRDIVDRQMRLTGSLIGVTFEGAEQAEDFIARARYIVPTTSFGGIHTTAERRARWGDDVAEGYVRLSVGCEPIGALWSDMSGALDALV